MNDTETKPRYIPEESGNPLPDLGKHGTFNEPPIPINRPRTEPSRAMSDSPQKYLLPGGAELRDIIKRRIEATSQSTKALCAALARAYQIRGGHYESVLNEIANMINSGELVQRDDELRVAEPEPTVTEPTEIDPVLWTMTHTQRVHHVLGTEPMTREALSKATGLKPRQVSKAAYLLIQQGCIEVVGDVPRTWRRKVQHGNAKRIIDEALSNSPTESKMDADDVCKAVLESLGDRALLEGMIIAEIIALTDWPHDEALTLLHDMLACGYVVRRDDGRISRPKSELETAVLTEEQTRDAVLERVSGVCDADVVIADVMRLSGWDKGGVAMLIDAMTAAGDLSPRPDGRISRPMVKQEDPPEYVVGDDDDGEIPEPGVGRPETPAYVLDSATIDFVQRDSGGHVADECSVTIDAAGLSFGGGDVMPFAAIDAVMPVLRRVHRALFGGDDG